MKFNIRKYNKFLYILFWIFVAMAVIFGLKYSDLEKPTESIEHWSCEFNDWELVNEDGTTTALTLPCNLKTEAGEEVRIQATLPDQIEDDTWLSIFAAENFTLYIDGVEEKSFIRDAVAIPGGVTKTVLFFVELTPDMAGKTIELYKYDSSNDNGYLRESMIGNSLGLVEYFYVNEFWVFIGFLFLAVMSIIVTIYGIYLKVHYKSEMSLSAMSLGVFLSSAWFLFDTDLFQLFTRIYYIDGTLSYLVALMVPFCFLYYLNVIQKHRYETAFTALLTANALVAIVMSVIHFMGICRFYDMYIWMDIAISVEIFVGFAICIVDMRRGYTREYSILLIGFIIFLTFAMIELISINFISNGNDGKCLCIGLYFLLIGAVIQQIRLVYNNEQAKERADAANEAKSSFLANMSHEIRTPLNSVLGMNEMILRENKDPQINEYAEHIDRSGKMLLGLINDVLDFSKIEAGKMEITNETYETQNLFSDVISILEERAANKSIFVNVDIDKEIPRYLIGDEMHLKQVLTNIISNAVKYTNQGSISIKATGDIEITEDRKTVCILNVSVSDTGIGIKEQDLDKIFQDFTRVDTNKNKNVLGTGLGLNITKRLVEEMGGQIYVTSTYQKGSTFTIDVPQEVTNLSVLGDVFENGNIPEQKYIVESAMFRAPRAKILVVDDNRVNRILVRQFLKRNDVQITEAVSGQECIKLCKNTRYNLIYMDHMMQDMDGIEALKTLRADTNSANQFTPVVALTANAVAGVRETYLSHGFSDYLAKPIDSKLLEETTMKYLPKEYVEECEVVSREIPDMKGERETEFDVNESYELNDFGEDAADGLNDFDEDTSHDYDSWDGLGGWDEPLEDLPNLIDHVTGLSYCANSEDVYREVLNAYVEDSLVETLKKDFDNKNWPDYGINAHAVKSSSLSIGASTLSEFAKTMERAAKDGNIDFVEQNHSEFLDLYLEVLNEGRNYLG